MHYCQVTLKSDFLICIVYDVIQNIDTIQYKFRKQMVISLQDNLQRLRKNCISFI